MGVVLSSYDNEIGYSYTNDIRVYFSPTAIKQKFMSYETSCDVKEKILLSGTTMKFYITDINIKFLLFVLSSKSL